MATETVMAEKPAVGFLQFGDSHFFHVNQSLTREVLTDEASLLEDAVQKLLDRALQEDREIPVMQAYLMEFAMDAAKQLRRASGETEA